jgi:phenylpyruvate tautomerase PptA (4-oxalocrotonate tautomerase family)
MPMIHFHYPAGSLTAVRKNDLAERLTHVLIEIEGGSGTDGPKARSISWVMFYEIANGSWAIGGKFDDSYVSPPGKFLVNVHVPEGSLSSDRKALVHRMVDQAVFDTFDMPVPDDPESRNPSIFVQITEWPQGNIGALGKTWGLADIGGYVGGGGDPAIHQHGNAYMKARAKFRATAGFPD